MSWCASTIVESYLHLFSTMKTPVSEHRTTANHPKSSITNNLGPKIFHCLWHRLLQLGNHRERQRNGLPDFWTINSPILYQLSFLRKCMTISRKQLLKYCWSKNLRPSDISIMWNSLQKLNSPNPGWTNMYIQKRKSKHHLQYAQSFYLVGGFKPSEKY